jgi:peptide/nickel transport system substrate-binding protein
MMTHELRRLHWLGKLLLVVLVLLPVWATGQTPAIGALAGKTDLIVVQGTDASRFDPHMSTASQDVSVTLNIFDNLIFREADNSLKPALATEWRNLNDTTWQIKIRRGVRFHDGEPLNAETVRFSISRTLSTGDPRVVTRATFATVDKVEVIDDYTLNITTTAPDPLLPARLAFYGGQIIPKQYFLRVGADEFNVKPVGTGPLRFVEWVKDDRVVLEANRDWWGGRIAFEKMILKPMPETAARVAALLRGEADIITKLPPDDVDRVKRSSRATAVGAPFAGFYVVATDYRRPFPMNNRYFHQALSLAIDRNAIVRDLWRGQAVLPNGMYPRGDWVYDSSVPPLEYSTAKSKELLQRIGYKGQEVVLEAATGYMVNDRQLGEALVAMWRTVGINVKLEIIEFSVRQQKVREKAFKAMFLADPTSPYGDPDGMVWRLTGPGSTQDYLRVARLDKLMVEARQTLDQNKRKSLYDQAQKIYLEYLQWIPIIQPIESYGIQRYVDWRPRPNQEILIKDVRLK